MNNLRRHSHEDSFRHLAIRWPLQPTHWLLMGKTETLFVRHGWEILIAVSFILGIFGVSDMVGGASDLQNGETVFMHSITGMRWNELKAVSPKVANLIDVKFRMDGAAITTIALLSIVVCLTGFRRGERWAWVAQWAIPLWMMLSAIFLLTVNKLPGSGTPVPVISGSILSVICVSMLGLSYRRFFRSKPELIEEKML